MTITNEPLRAWLMGQWHSGRCYVCPHVSGTVCIFPYSLWNGYFYFTGVRIEKSLHLLYPALWTILTAFNFNFYEGDFFIYFIYFVTFVCVPSLALPPKVVLPYVWLLKFFLFFDLIQGTSILNPSLILPIGHTTGSCLCAFEFPQSFPFPSRMRLLESGALSL